MLDPWQAWVLTEALGEVDGDGRRSAFEVGLCCPRQNGKSAILEAFMLAALFLDGGWTVYSAHEFKTAQVIWRRFRAMVKADAELWPLVARETNSTNEMGLETHDGSRLQFLARSGTQGRGFSADRLIFDEAMILSAASMGAMIPTLSARRNAQVWYAGSAGMAGPESDHWRSIRDRGRAGSSPRLAWFEWCVDEPPANLRDRMARQSANPGYPNRLTDESLDDEIDTLSSREETVLELVRERFGVWDEPGGPNGTVMPADAWDDCRDASSQIVGSPAFGVHVSPDRVLAVIAAAGHRRDGVLHVEVVAERRGTSWVTPRLVALQAHSPVSVVLDPSSATGSLIPELEAAGIEVSLINGPELQQAAGSVFDAVMRGELRHLGQKPLDDAVHGAVLRPAPRGGARWYPATSGYVAALDAVTMAVHGMSQAFTGDPSVYVF